MVAEVYSNCQRTCIMSQLETLRECITQLCNERRDLRFSLQDAYGFIEDIRSEADDPEAIIRRLLQELREEDIVSFEGGSGGNYALRAVELDPGRRAALEEQGIDLPAFYLTERLEHLAETHSRDTALVREAKERLGTQCLMPCCDNTFTKEDGSPYIEVHHVVPLYLGGEDRLENLSVVCAHHHRMAHFADSDTKARLRDELLEITRRRLE